MKFKESALAHKLLDGLEGIEIGGSAHNAFGLKTRNVDYTSDMTVFKEEEIRMCGQALPVDIVAPGDKLPLEDNSVDFVLSSHVIEHFQDPIKALKEWHRVVRPGGFIYVIAPHKERMFDHERQRTTLAEMVERHGTGETENEPGAAHCSYWVTQDFVDLVEHLGWKTVAVQDRDDKVGNGFAVVIQVEKGTQAKPQVVRRTDRRMSMTFLLNPTTHVRTGGAACILEYAKRFQERGHDVSITTWPKFRWPAEEPFPQLGFQVPIYYDRNAKAEDLPAHLLEPKNPRDYLSELQYYLASMNMITRAIPRVDLIVAADWEGVIPAWQSGMGKPVHFPQHYDEVFFSQDQSQSSGFGTNPLLQMLCRTAFQMPVYRIANSTWLANEFKRRFGDIVPVVKHGIDSTKFQAREKLSAKDGIMRVVTYCRPEKWKGFQDALPAMYQLMQKHPGKIEWHVYGFPHPTLGPDNGVAPYRFHGVLNHDELSKLYAESDIVLCPSWYESFPLPPLEAMACGTAVITTPYGTEDYAIDGHNAIVVRPRVVSDFAIALDGLVRKPELREQLARNGRAMAESLNWDTAVGAREELLWRIHNNVMPNNALHGFDTGILDGHGIAFEHLTAEAQARDGQLLQGADGQHYVVEARRLRRVSDPFRIGLDPSQAQPLDLLTLLRNAHGPLITSAANYYGTRV